MSPRRLLIVDITVDDIAQIDKATAYLGTEFPQANIFVVNADASLGFYLDDYRAVRKLALSVPFTAEEPDQPKGDA